MNYCFVLRSLPPPKGKRQLMPDTFETRALQFTQTAAVTIGGTANPRTRPNKRRGKRPWGAREQNGKQKQEQKGWTIRGGWRESLRHKDSYRSGNVELCSSPLFRLFVSLSFFAPLSSSFHHRGSSLTRCKGGGHEGSGRPFSRFTTI